eukprot:7040183-Pyramimonas_sp.AAC.1
MPDSTARLVLRVNSILSLTGVSVSLLAILDSDDDFEDGEGPIQGECSSAQPMSSYPDAVSAARNTPSADEETEG